MRIELATSENRELTEFCGISILFMAEVNMDIHVSTPHLRGLLPSPSNGVYAPACYVCLAIVITRRVIVELNLV